MSQGLQIIHSNKKPLGETIFYEFLAGAITSFCVSPINAIVDRSVIQNANGKTPLWQGARNGFRRLFTTPHLFFTSFQFKWMYVVYTATYAVSNIADHVRPSQQIDPAITKLIMTFMANSGFGIPKDRAYTQRFGVVNIKPFPYPSLGLFFVRDICAIFAGFTLPPILAKKLMKFTGMDYDNSLKVAQISSPCLMQIIATPIHLMGLDIYNREGKTILDRIKYVKSKYFQTISIRVMRFLPAFGIGGIVNTELRKHFKKQKSAF